MSDYSTEEFWKGAPEGATHYQPAKDENHAPVFWRVVDGVAREVWCPSAFGGAHTANFKYGPEGNDCFDAARSVTRPAQQWSGDGLPPVGTVCELRTKIGGWGEAEIKYHGRAICVWLWIRRDGNTEQIEFAENPERLEFRPIKTAAQIAAQEREAAIDEMSGWAGVTGLSRDRERRVLSRLYDAGYERKVKP